MGFITTMEINDNIIEYIQSQFEDFCKHNKTLFNTTSQFTTEFYISNELNVDELLIVLEIKCKIDKIKAPNKIKFIPQYCTIWNKEDEELGEVHKKLKSIIKSL